MNNDKNPGCRQCKWFEHPNKCACPDLKLYSPWDGYYKRILSGYHPNPNKDGNCKHWEQQPPQPVKPGLFVRLFGKGESK